MQNCILWVAGRVWQCPGVGTHSREVSTVVFYCIKRQGAIISPKFMQNACWRQRIRSRIVQTSQCCRRRETPPTLSRSPTKETAEHICLCQRLDDASICQQRQQIHAGHIIEARMRPTRDDLTLGTSALWCKLETKIWKQRRLARLKGHSGLQKNKVSVKVRHRRDHTVYGNVCL